MDQEHQPKLTRSYLEGVYIRFDTNEIRATRERLRAGSPYQPGDIMPIFDANGDHRFIRLDNQNQETWEATMGGRGMGAALFVANSAAVQMTENQLNKFTRGTRADISALAHQMRWETTQLTTLTRTWQKQMREAERTGDYSKVEPLPDEVMRDHLRQGAQGFFYGEPVEYQTLLDAATEFTQWNKDRAEQRGGVQLANLRTVQDLEQALRQVMGEEGIPLQGESRITGAVLHKYASRMSTGLRLAMAVLETWYQEQGSAQLQRDPLNE